MVQNFPKENHIKAVQHLDVVGNALKKKKRRTKCWRPAVVPEIRFCVGKKKLCNMSSMKQSENGMSQVLLQQQVHALIW